MKVIAVVVYCIFGLG